MVTLDREAETLLIPLYGRAMMSRSGRIISDVYAERMTEEIDYDFTRLRIPQKLQALLSIRAAIIDDYAAAFLKAHPDGLALHLGCGLDSRFFRLDNGRVRWYDLDFDDVIALKARLCGINERYTLIPSSVTDFKWISRIDAADIGKPTLIIAEGLLMYLDNAQVKELFLRLRDAFGDSAFVFDTYSRMTARHAGRQRSLKTTGARVKWGVDGPGEIEGFGEGITHEKTFYLTDRDLGGLGGYFGFMFRFAGRFKTAKEAHRIYSFRLEKPAE